MKNIKSIIAISIILLVTLLSGCASAEVKAAKKGDIPSLQEYIDQGGDVNEPQRGGTTLLMYASEAGQIRAINFLLDNGAIISLKDNNGRTAFIYAVIPGKQGAAELLLQRGADINVTLPSGDNALILAAAAQKQAMVKMLLSRGAELNQKNNSGWSALTSSLSRDAQKSSGMDPVSLHLINEAAQINKDSENVQKIAFSAAASGNIDVMEYLLNLGFDLEKKSSKGETLLFTAAASQKVDMVRFLLSRGADWSVKDNSGWSMLMRSLYKSASAGQGPDETALLLMEKGARPEGNSSQGEATGFKAAQTGALEILTLLFDNSLSPLVKDNNGNNLLMAGIANSKVVSLLIIEGIAVDSRNNQRITPLILAASGGHKESLSLLLQAGAEPDLRDDNGMTALFYAAVSKDPDMVRKLLLAEASIHNTDKSGNTALHKAAEAGTAETVRLLLTAGIYVDPVNSRGETPYTSSYRNAKYGEEIRTILTTAGAKIPVGQEPGKEESSQDAVPDAKSLAEVPVNQAVPVPVPIPLPSPVPVPVEKSEPDVEKPAEEPVKESSGEAEQITETPKPAEPVSDAGQDVKIRFGWPSINPSAVKGWNNSDKLTGSATIQIAYASDSKWFYEYSMDIPLKGANADRYEADLDMGELKKEEYKAVLTLPTKKGNSLVCEIRASADLDGRLILYFDDFKYIK